MEDYIQAPLREMIDHIMLQIGKNGVPLIKYTERFSCSIISLAFKQKRTVFFQYQAPQDEMARIKKDVN